MLQIRALAMLAKITCYLLLDYNVSYVNKITVNYSWNISSNMQLFTPYARLQTLTQMSRFSFMPTCEHYKHKLFDVL